MDGGQRLQVQNHAGKQMWGHRSSGAGTTIRPFGQQSCDAQVFGHRQIEWFCIAPHVASTLQGLLDQIGYVKNVHW